MRKTNVVRGVVIVVMTAGIALWNMDSQEAVALAPVSEDSTPALRIRLWEENLEGTKNIQDSQKKLKLKQMRRIRVREHKAALRRIKEEKARRERLRQIQECCGIQVSAADRTILEKIVQAEAGNQDHKGKLLVANVILNRVRSGKFPSSIRAVVFSPRQFSPVSDGSYTQAIASKDTRNAVDEALHGVDGSQGALYFMDRRYADSANVSWFDQSLTRLFSYGGHEFYK